MENASKALIIAGSVLVSIIVLSLLVMFFNNLRSLVGTEQQIEGELSAAEFNNQFDVYARNVYGTELFSLANKIVSYNEQEKRKDSGYEEIHLKVILNENLNDEFFKKNTSGYTEEEWATQLKALENKVEEIGKLEYKAGLYTRTVVQLVNMRTNEKNEFGFTESLKNEATKIDDTKTIAKGKYTLQEATNLYNTYKSNLTKIKEQAYKYKTFNYSNTTGRVTEMIFER